VIGRGPQLDQLAKSTCKKANLFACVLAGKPNDAVRGLREDVVVLPSRTGRYVRIAPANLTAQASGSEGFFKDRYTANSRAVDYATRHIMRQMR
jgi:hypothetical protein